MIERSLLLFEALSIVICLHCLYGEKFRLNIVNTSYLALHMIIMTAINYYELGKVYTFLIYPLIAVYCGVRFGFKWKEIITNYILHMAIMGGSQLIIAIAYSCIFHMLSLNMLYFADSEVVVINAGVLLIVAGILPKCKLHKLSVYLQDKERILVIFLFFCLALVLFSFTNYKVIDGFNFYQSMVLFFSVLLFCLVAGQLGKYKIKSKEIETELKMHILFSDSFRNLIDDIRVRQHEFDNHINAIYSLHYTCDSYEKLVTAQNEYSQAVLKENRYNKLLKADNPLLIGFLYGNFVRMEKLGVEVTYHIEIGSFNVDIPVYKLVEILGNLLKNAVEAMKEATENKALYVAVIEVDGEFTIEVRNRSKYIDYGEIESFFKKGFSKKEKDRGLGLYNVKNICNDYSLNILCENKLLDETNWLSFIITNRKEAI